jgi:hypothetical protein
VLLKNTTDKQQFSQLARQVYPKKSTSLYDSYLDETEKAHIYLLLDLGQDTNDDTGIESTYTKTDNLSISTFHR